MPAGSGFGTRTGVMSVSRPTAAVARARRTDVALAMCGATATADTSSTGRARFSAPVDPWDETRAATETWFTVATHLARPASRSDTVLRSTHSRIPADEDTAAQDTVTDLFEQSDPDPTDELSALRRPPAVDRPRWARSEAITNGTVYRSAAAMATFAPDEIEESRRDPKRWRAVLLGQALHIRPRWPRL